MKKTELQKALAAIAPSICIRTIWEVDEDCGPISLECDGFNPADNHKWQAWRSQIKASAIVNGETVDGDAYLGGTWELCGDEPQESNPEISGYENQMTIDALRELQTICESDSLSAEIDVAVAHCEREAQISYDKQMAESPN